MNNDPLNPNAYTQPVETINPQPSNPNFTDPVQQTAQPKKTNDIAIVAFVLSLIGLAIPGLICGIIGVNKSKKEGLGNKGLAVASIVISVLGIIVQFFLLIAPVLVFFSFKAPAFDVTRRNDYLALSSEIIEYQTENMGELPSSSLYLDFDETDPATGKPYRIIFEDDLESVPIPKEGEVYIIRYASCGETGLEYGLTKRAFAIYGYLGGSDPYCINY